MGKNRNVNELLLEVEKLLMEIKTIGDDWTQDFSDTDDSVQPYEVSEKDIGSLCYFTDCEHDNDDYVGVLTKIALLDQPYKELMGDYWTHCKPYTDAIKLHFKPFTATNNSGKPSDCSDEYALLMSNGDMVFSSRNSHLPDGIFLKNWRSDRHVIGYCPLCFVNPILDK